MKTTVIVTLRGEAVVRMDVEHEPGEEPTDLTKEDRTRARHLAGVDSSWEIAEVEEIK